MKQQAGQSDQFDDLILDPEGAAEGPELSQKDQGYEDSSEEGESDSSDKNPKSSKELETFDNLDPNSQINQLEDKEDNGEEGKKDDKEDKSKEEGKKDESKDKKDDEGKEDKKEGEEGEKEEEDGDKKEPGKTLRLFQDGKKYEVPVDATLKVKVDGKWEKVPVSELRDNYSGQKAWKQEIAQAKSKSSELEAKEQELTSVQQTLKTTIETTRNDLKEAIEGSKNPMEALNKIIDMVQIDSYDFNKALFDSLKEELVLLDQMDEYEQKAYWLEKKTNHLTKRHESLEEMQRNTQAREERISRVDQLREANGVSEEDFVSAVEQLSKMGKELSDEQVIEYAASMPFITKAEELLTPYEDQLSDDEFEEMMAKVANTMKTNKDITEEDMAAWLATNYEVEDIINEANSKAQKLGAGGKDHDDKNQRVPSQRDIYSNATYESFEDFEY